MSSPQETEAVDSHNPLSGDASQVRVVLGVGGGIAAYKACELLRRLSEAGLDVTVVPTEAALDFVGAPTWAALSGKPVSASVWDRVHEVPHVRLGQAADLVVIAPATANLLAKAAHGIADDLLTNTLLTARCPVVMAPAMHTEMWENPATVANAATLRARGVVVIDPAHGRLTGADSGPGRLPEPSEIFAIAMDVLARGTMQRDLQGKEVLISAGGTREPLDPVRYLGNRSSGLQGLALARAAVLRGAKVRLVTANVALPLPVGAEVTCVETTAELHDEMVRQAEHADIIVMAAAPADFRPASISESKIKKLIVSSPDGVAGASSGVPPTLELLENPDILVSLVRQRAQPKQIIVGFAAETGDGEGSVLDHAQAKLHRKGCDLLVVNDVSGGQVFGSTENQAVILSPHHEPVAVPHGAKGALAHAIFDLVLLDH